MRTNSASIDISGVESYGDRGVDCASGGVDDTVCCGHGKTVVEKPGAAQVVVARRHDAQPRHPRKLLHESREL